MTRDPAKSAAQSVCTASAAGEIAARLESAEGKARLAEAAAASKSRAGEIIRSVNVDPKFLARRMTF